MFAGEDPENPPEVWSHHTLPAFMETQSIKGTILYARAMRQFGNLLPSGAHINSGIGPRLRLASHGMIQPTKFLYTEEQDVQIAGEFKLMH